MTVFLRNHVCQFTDYTKDLERIASFNAATQTIDNSGVIHEKTPESRFSWLSKLKNLIAFTRSEPLDPIALIETVKEKLHHTLNSHDRQTSPQQHNALVNRVAAAVNTILASANELQAERERLQIDPVVYEAKERIEQAPLAQSRAAETEQSRDASPASDAGSPLDALSPDLMGSPIANRDEEAQAPQAPPQGEPRVELQPEPRVAVVISIIEEHDEADAPPFFDGESASIDLRTNEVLEEEVSHESHELAEQIEVLRRIQPDREAKHHLQLPCGCHGHKHVRTYRQLAGYSEVSHK